MHLGMIRIDDDVLSIFGIDALGLLLAHDTNEVFQRVVFGQTLAN